MEILEIFRFLSEKFDFQMQFQNLKQLLPFLQLLNCSISYLIQVKGYLVFLKFQKMASRFE
jgi:hypothetical protein